MAAVTVQSDAVKAGIMPDANTPAGVVLSRTETYTETAARDANSIVQMIPIPKYAQILDIHVYIADSGDGRTCDIGDGGDPDRFFDGLDPSSAAIRKTLVADGVPIAPYEYTADDTIDVKWLGDTLEEGQVITMTVFYRMGNTIADD